MGRVLYGRHERLDIDPAGFVEYRFRSEPHPTDGYAYKLVLRGAAPGTPTFLTHYNDDKTNPNCVKRTG